MTRFIKPLYKIDQSGKKPEILDLYKTTRGPFSSIGESVITVVSEPQKSQMNVPQTITMVVVSMLWGQRVL